jgi:hypothetical protein
MWLELAEEFLYSIVRVYHDTTRNCKSEHGCAIRYVHARVSPPLEKDII